MCTGFELYHCCLVSFCLFFFIKDAEVLRDASLTYQTNMTRAREQMMEMSTKSIGLKEKHEVRKMRVI